MSLLNVDPSSRPTASKALEHSWFKLGDEMKEASSISADSLTKNVQKFNAETKLKQAVQDISASYKLANEDKKELEKVFKASDKDKSGKLSPDELKNGLKIHFGVEVDEKDFAEMWQNIDTNKDGNIDVKEFLESIQKASIKLANSKLKKAFDNFDADGNGVLT